MIEDKYKNIKLISCDIDGTLMNTNRMLSEKFVEIVKDLKDLGVQFTFASGRLPYKIMPLVSQINSDLPFVACNGGCIYQNEKFLLKKMFSILDGYNGNTEKTILKKEAKSVSIELSLCSLILFCIGVIICYEFKIV